MESYWNSFQALAPVYQVGCAAGCLMLFGYFTRYLAWRLREKSQSFNAYTTNEEAINGLDLRGKLAVITGCNTGIGKATAKILVKQGCKIVMACRNEKKANDAKHDILKYSNLSSEDKNNSEQIIVMKLDLSSLESVKQFAIKFNEMNLKIDYLINNAGIMALPSYKTTKDGFEMQFGTNHIGHYYLTNLLMPSLLRKSTESSDTDGSDAGEIRLPRVITVSSFAHFHANDYNWLLNLFNHCIEKKDYMGDKRDEYNPWRNYGISKSSNMLFARELAKKYNNQIISVSLHPGAISTQLAQYLGQSLNSILKLVVEIIITPLWIPKHMKSIDQGAATTLRCVSMTDNEIKNGAFYLNCHNDDEIDELYGACKIDKQVKNGELATKLWELTKLLIESKGYQVEQF